MSDIFQHVYYIVFSLPFPEVVNVLIFPCMSRFFSLAGHKIIIVVAP